MFRIAVSVLYCCFLSAVGFCFWCILRFIVARSLSNWPNSLVFPNDLSINLPAFVWYMCCTKFLSPSTIMSCRTSSTSSSVSLNFDGDNSGGNDCDSDSDEFEGEFYLVF